MSASKKNLGKIESAAMAARSNPYVQRLIEDRELRQTLRGAYGAVSSAYGRINNGKAPTKALLEDRKLQRDLTAAAGALREISSALQEGPAGKGASGKPRKRRLRRSLAMLIIGGGLALVLSSDLRSKALDLLFGSEEEFNYSSSTAPTESAPAPEAASSAVS